MSMQQDSNGGNTKQEFVGVAIAFGLAMTILIICYVFCTRRRRRRRRHVRTAGHYNLRRLNSSLDDSDIASLPTFAYRRSVDGQVATAEGGSIDDAAAAVAGAAETQCAVCLSDFAEGEMVRLLPNCKHVFHMDCIDMWLCSHSTCPVCRADVKVPIPPAPETPELHLDSSAPLPLV